MKFFNPLRNHKAPFQLQISDGRAFLPWNDGLLEIPFDGSPFRRHTGFSGPVVGAEYRNGRLWVATEGVILSASPEGGDRQIALSKFDETDRLFPDRESRFNFRLRGFFAEPGNGNRFLLVENDQLTRFDADRRTLAPLLRSREFLSTPECVIQRSGMKITIMNFSNSGRTCSFGWWDPVRQRGSFLRCGPPPERREPDSATPFRRFEESAESDPEHRQPGKNSRLVHAAAQRTLPGRRQPLGTSGHPLPGAQGSLETIRRRMK